MGHSTPLAYFGGAFVAQEAARLPLDDAGFVWGATITDLCRTVKHRLYRWPEHLARFRRSCWAVGINPPRGDEEITGLAGELVTHNAALLERAQDLALVLLATPGPVGYYTGKPSGPGDAEPTFVMHTFPLPFARYRPLFQQGASLLVPSIRQIPAVCIDPRIKQRSRLHWWLAQQQVLRSDVKASALLLDQSGHVTETAAANFLIARDGEVITPPKNAVLEGVSLGVLRELCGKLGIPFSEQPLTLDDCLNAHEALLTSTPYCVAGVGRINGAPVPWPGAIFRRLLQAWSEELGLDIQRQIEKTD
jgi:branched-subunit amino acid aminotransferase/4-amino-4-deoxychorismate lyase